MFQSHVDQGYLSCSVYNTGKKKKKYCVQERNHNSQILYNFHTQVLRSKLKCKRHGNEEDQRIKKKKNQKKWTK